MLRKTKNNILRTTSLLLPLMIFSAHVYATQKLPGRIVFGLSQEQKDQIWILEQADGFYLKIGSKGEPLRKSFPKIPYPLDFIETTLGRYDGGCNNIFRCRHFNSGLLRIQTTTSIQKTFPAGVEYTVTISDNGQSVNLALTVVGEGSNAMPTTSSISLDFPRSDVLIDQ